MNKDDDKNYVEVNMIEVEVKFEEGDEKFAKIILEELNKIHREKFFFTHRAFQRKKLLTK